MPTVEGKLRSKRNVAYATGLCTKAVGVAMRVSGTLPRQLEGSCRARDNFYKVDGSTRERFSPPHLSLNVTLKNSFTALSASPVA